MADKFIGVYKRNKEKNHQLEKISTIRSLMSITDFTYTAYLHLLKLIAENGYTITGYHNYSEVAYPCILRHDIDNDVEKALELAKLEAVNSVQSTYFVLLNTDFYNVFSSMVNKMLKEILSMGHEIGLHFDETHYPPPHCQFVEYIQKEILLLEQIIERPVTTVSMHRPSQLTLEAGIVIPNVVNSYSQIFFKDFKYISDSRHNWREDAENIVSCKQYKKLHILTHPFWYTENKKTCKEKIKKFINNANQERYISMSKNFRMLDEFVKCGDIK